MNKLVVSVFYVGFLPFAPGTFGSLCGVTFGIFLQRVGGFPLILTSVFFLFFVGWVAASNYILKNRHDHDPKEIVIDEVVGQLLSYFPFSFYLWIFQYESFFSTFWDWLIAFTLFRAFDIAKPWPIKLADNLKSAYGIMLDDVVAGLLSAILISIMIIYF